MSPFPEPSPEPGLETTVQIAAAAPTPQPKGGTYGRALLLFLLTTCTTITLGSVWLQLIRTDYMVSTGMLGPALTPRLVLSVWNDPAKLLLGLQFALPVLTILLAHELGHVFACRRYGLDATPPYFLPVPFGFGTFGAFIRIRSRIRTRRELFDVGAAGPFAGFVVLLPFLLYGIAHSEPVAVDLAEPTAEIAEILPVPGWNLGIYLVSRWFHGPLEPGTFLNFHPFALAAWLGMLATAINLLPFGQLDGGHVLYAAAGSWQKRLAWPFWAVMALLAYHSPSWLLWCLLTLILGLAHPRVADERPIGLKRQVLALAALAILVVCFIPAPIEEKLITPSSGAHSEILQAEVGAISSTKVTGPSLTSSTSMTARNLPVATR